MAAVGGTSVLDGYGLLRTSAGAWATAFKADGNPSRRIEDHPHILDVIPSRDMHRYFSLIVDACAAPGTNYLAKIPFLTELEVAKIWNESRFEWDAVSVVGAAGLQQLMVATAREYGLVVVDTPELLEFERCIVDHGRLRSDSAVTRQKLYRLVESDGGSISEQTVERMNALRSELAEIDTKREKAYQDLLAARKTYIEKIHALNVDSRRTTDGRFVPEECVPVGVKHLAKGILECKRFFGGPVEMNVWRGIAAYNSGLSRVKTWGGLPFIEETVYFTRNVVSDLTRVLEMKYAYATGDPAIIAETRARIRLRDAYFIYVVKVGDNFFRIVREQIMERYWLSYSEALHYIKNERGDEIDPDNMSLILPNQKFRIYVPQ